MAKKEIKEETVKTKEEKVEIQNNQNNINDNKLIPIFIIVIVLVVVLGMVLFLTKDMRLSKEKKLEKSLVSMGEAFYTDFYYVEISKGKSSQEVSEFLSKFQDVGIKINLDNLSRYTPSDSKKGDSSKISFEDEIAKFKNNDKECDKTNTRAVIYPKSPYGKSDYTIKAELDCGFSTDKK